ncbi:26S proteasome non-ATPase regulatory subunit 6 [Chironomus tepperi]|uniref:26S proteasome non-ATPase regulatory subunit 6 n=1 Tax=Chironomus tepperi TaxID=113505 RepID=UPI00391F6B96
MPAENLEEQGLEKNPKLELAQYKFLLTLKENLNNEELKTKLMDEIKAENMAMFYEETCTELGWTVDQQLLAEMKAVNAKKIEELDAVIEDAEKNLGEMEVREANLKKSEYLCRIGDKNGSISSFRKTYEKTVSLGHRLDIIFHNIRIGLFYLDHDLITRNIEKAKTLIEEGGDWDRRNRLKVYQGVYSVAIRDFKSAAQFFLDTVSTFTSYELMDYPTFVRYTVYVSMISLPRNELRDKVIKGAEIQEILHQLPDVKEYLFSLYNCHYADFFINLVKVEGYLRADFMANPHYRFYVREMRILAYTQLLESYRSLTLTYMAEAFGVSIDYIDSELSRFIAAGRLHCKIDRVGGIVETNRPDSKNYQYQSTIKQGDLLLNRIQKLSRVINI